MFFIENRQFGFQSARRHSVRSTVRAGLNVSGAALPRVAFADAPLAWFGLGDVGRCEGLGKRLAFILSSMFEILHIGSPAMGGMWGEGRGRVV
jgi:hypothetical protein